PWSTFAVSRNGVLVYHPVKSNSRRQIAWRDRTGTVLRQVGNPVPNAVDIQLSPDEKSAAIMVWDGKKADLLTMDLASGVTTPLTRDGSLRSAPRWSPDSKHLAVPLMGGSMEQIDTASGQVELLGNGAGLPADWLHDERSILSINNGELVLLSLSAGHATHP